MKQVISPMPIMCTTILHSVSPNKSLQWTHGNVTHFAMREMRAITVRQ
jgi:hypothetical protein